MREAWQLSAAETAARIRAGRLSCLAAVESSIERMRAVNGEINAVTYDLSRQALADARRADGELRTGAALGPLHGVPVTIKENVDQGGVPTPNGVRDFADLIAPADAPLVASLKRAGAIVIGRTNTPEFSFRWFTENPLRGRTNNPWHPGITAGGSSGGAAAAVALGIGAIAHGNDLGGSLRYPAYACGVATIRPSPGRVPAYNPSATEERPPAVQMMAVHGPICREVRDLRLALAAMAARDPHDPWWVPAPLDGPPPPLPVRVAVTRGPYARRCHPAVAANLDRAAGMLADAGYAVEAIDPPAMEEIAERFNTLIAADTRVMSEALMRRLGSADLQEVLDSFIGTTAAVDLDGYVRALADRTRLWRAWSLFLEDRPLVLMPVSQQLPLPHGEDLCGRERSAALREEQAPLYIVNFLGLPSAAVPTGIEGGVPLGVQLLSRRYREDLALDAAQAIEDRVGVLAKELWKRRSAT